MQAKMMESVLNQLIEVQVFGVVEAPGTVRVADVETPHGHGSAGSTQSRDLSGTLSS